MSPKKRLKEHRGLPKRWTRKHGAYYYLVPASERANWDDKAWFRLGDTLAQAHQTFSERLSNNGATVYTMQDLLDKFEFEYLPKLKPKTQQYYLYGLPMVRQGFAVKRIPISRVEPYHAYQMTAYLEEHGSPKQAKVAAEVLSSALSYAVKLGVVSKNPLIGQFKKPGTEGRNREVSDEELIAFASGIPRRWQLYLSLKLHTHGRRKGELLRIRYSDLGEKGITFVNNKRLSDQFRVPWTPALRLITQELITLNTVKGDVSDPFLFQTRSGEPYMKEDGTPSGFNSMWQRWMSKAVKEGRCKRFTEHDIRAKAVEAETLEVASRLLRHTSTQVTKKHYRRGVEDI